MFLPLAAVQAASEPGLPAQYFGSSLRALVDQPSIFFDGDRRLFAIVAGFFVCCTIGLAFLGKRESDGAVKSGFLWRVLGSPWTFGVLAALSFALCRWPAITFYNDMGLDESVLLAGANTLRFDPVFWRTVQSTTSGPLDYYPLMIPALFGMPLDFSASRLVCLLVEMLDLLICYKICRVFMDDFFSRLGILPIWAFWSIATSPDFVQYTSEAIPILILTLATYLAIRWIKAPAPKLWLLLVTGFVLGMLPFAKFQALPSGACIALSVAIALVLAPGDAVKPGKKLGQLCLFVLAGMTPSMLVLLFAAANHVTEAFWITCVKYNLNFTASNQHGFLAALEQAAYGMVSVPQFKDLTISLCAAAILAKLVALRANPRGLFSRSFAEIRLSPATIVLFGVTPVAMFWAIMARGAAGTMWYFYHYYLFLLIPLTLGCMVWLNWLFSVVVEKSWVKSRPNLPRWLHVTVACIPTAALIWQFTDPANYLGEARYYTQDNRDAAAGIVLGLTKPTDSLVVWGWRPELYVETQLRQGCSFGTVERELGTNGSANTQFYRDQFMRDVERSQPKVIADSTGPRDATFQSREDYGHEVFAQFTQYLGEHYKYLGESRDGFRIYLKN